MGIKLDNGVYVPGLKMSKGHKVLDEVDIALYNIQGQRILNGGYKVHQGSDVDNITNTVEAMLNGYKIIVGRDDKDGNRPDIVVESYRKDKTQPRTIIGFEHFSVGCRHIVKRGRSVNKTYEFLSREVYSDDNLRLRITSKPCCKLYTDINSKCNCIGSIDKLINSFRYSYRSHFDNIEEYKENIHSTLDKYGINHKDVQTKIWFIIDDIDSMIISKLNKSDTYVKMPLPLVPDILDIINNIGYVDGIIYIGITGTYVISKSDLVEAQCRNEYKNHEIITINNMTVSVHEEYLKGIKKCVRIYTMHLAPWLEKMFSNLEDDATNTFKLAMDLDSIDYKKIISTEVIE